MHCLARIHRVKLLLPPIEKLQWLVTGDRLIRQVISPAAIGINVRQMLPQVAGEEPTDDGKVLVMAVGECSAIGPRFAARDDAPIRGRTIACKLSREVHCTEDY